MKTGILGAAAVGFFAFALIAQAATIYSQGATGTLASTTYTSGSSLTTTGPITGTIKAFKLELSFSRMSHAGLFPVNGNGMRIAFDCGGGAQNKDYDLSSGIVSGVEFDPPNPTEVILTPSFPIVASGPCQIQFSVLASDAPSISHVYALNSRDGVPFFEAYDTVGVPPVVSSASIGSNNASTSLAKIGDTVSVSFSTDVDIVNAAVTIGTHAAAIATTTPRDFVASATLDATDAEGAVPFSVTVTNAVGDDSAAVSSATDASSVTFDMTAPNLAITGGVVGGFASSSPVLIAFSDEASATTLCSFDAEATSTCSGSATATLADGSHSLFLSSTDAAGNATTTSFDFTLDTIAPALSITAGPADGSATTSDAVSFAFDAELGATVDCAFDGATTTSCTSPQLFSPLSDGSHIFAVFAADAAGNMASTSVTFSVDTTAPSLVEVAAIGSTTDATPEYSFTSSEAGATSYGGSCASAATAAASGSNTITLNTLSVGSYSDCTVAVTDAAGNTSADLSITAFDIIAPPAAPSSGGGSSSSSSNIGNGPPVANSAPVAVIPTNPSAPANTAPAPAPTNTQPPAQDSSPEVLGTETSNASQNEPSQPPAASTETPNEPSSETAASPSDLAASPATSGTSFPAWILWAVLAGILIGGGAFFGKKLIS